MFIETYMAAGSSNTKPEQLTLLALDPDKRIRARVAENPGCPLPTLLYLLRDAESEVRAAITWRTTLCSLFTTRLMVDPNPDVRFALAENPCVGKRVLFVLSRDENPFVAWRATETLRRVIEDETLHRRRTKSMMKTVRMDIEHKLNSATEQLNSISMMDETRKAR